MRFHMQGLSNEDVKVFVVIKGGHKKEVRENVPWQERSYSSYNTRVALPVRCIKQRWN